MENGEHHLGVEGFDNQRKSINRHQSHYSLQSIVVDGGRCIRKSFHGNHTTLPCHFLPLFLISMKTFMCFGEILANIKYIDGWDLP